MTIKGGVRYNMRAVRLFLPDPMVKALDNLVQAGRYSSRSAAIRVAILNLLKKEKVEIPVEVR